MYNGLWYAFYSSRSKRARGRERAGVCTAGAPVLSFTLVHENESGIPLRIYASFPLAIYPGGSLIKSLFSPPAIRLLAVAPRCTRLVSYRGVYNRAVAIMVFGYVRNALIKTRN